MGRKLDGLYTARRKLNKLFLQFNNVTTACQFYNAIIDSLNFV